VVAAGAGVAAVVAAASLAVVAEEEVVVVVATPAVAVVLLGLPAAVVAVVIPVHLEEAAAVEVATPVHREEEVAEVRGLPEAEHPDPPNYLPAAPVQAAAAVREEAADEFPHRPHSVRQAAVAARPSAAARQICHLSSESPHSFPQEAIVRAAVPVQAQAIVPRSYPQAVAQAQIAPAEGMPAIVPRSSRQISPEPAIVREPAKALVNVPARAA